MTGGIFSGGVIFVVAAVLWTAVLVPSWIRRREFREAERHALRLQRTLRVLAETAEVPTEVRVEATAKQALAHEKILRSAQRQQEAERAAELAAQEAERVRAEIHAEHMKRKQATMSRARKLRRPVARRMRAIAALVALLALLGALVGIGTAIAGQGPATLLIAGAVFASATGVLVLLAPGRAKVRPVVAVGADAEPTAQAVVAVAPDERAAVAAPETDAGAAAHAAAQAAARARIDRARALARARAAAAAAAPVVRNQPDSILLQETMAAARMRNRADQVAETESAQPATVAASAARIEPAAAPESQHSAADRFRNMGVIGDTSEGMLDLDAVLRSRRNAS